MKKLYLVTDDDQDPWHVIADDMGQVETYFNEKMDADAETIKLLDDKLIIIEKENPTIKD